MAIVIHYRFKCESEKKLYFLFKGSFHQLFLFIFLLKISCIQ